MNALATIVLPAALPAAFAADAELARDFALAEKSVRIEARYEIDEYDVLILSADDSGALLTWLTAHGYRVPMQAGRVVESYLKQGMKFFVAKVDLRRRAARGLTQLRPLQFTRKPAQPRRKAISTLQPDS